MSDGNWWVDDPIDEPSKDLFGRGPFVTRVVDLLDQIGSRPSSTVVGLVGPWGSGKTSTIQMIVAGLDLGRWGVTWINPWALSGPDAVVTELLGAIRAAVPEKSTAGARVRRQLSRYGVLATPALSLVPVVGSAATAVANEAIQRLADQGTTFQEQAEQVRDALDALARPILVVIDDVDRLQPEQLLAVFRAVRALGRLPYVHYVLAYDQETILDVLSATPIAYKNGARAVAFLEKIVTLRLEQPPVRLEHAESLFNTGLADALGRAAAPLNEDAQRRMGEEREVLLLRVLTEPRSVARLLAQIDIYLPLVGAAEVDVVDFITLTFLRTTYPRLYQAIALHRSALVDDTDLAGLRAEFDESGLARLDVPAPHTGRVAAALQRLFPCLTTDPVRSIVAQHQRRGRRRISDRDYIERYFALTSITGEISDDSLVRAIRDLAEGRRSVAVEDLTMALRPDLTDAHACARAARALRRAESLSTELSGGEAAAVIPYVFEQFDHLRVPSAGGFGPDEAATVWLAALLRRADGGPLPAIALRDPGLLPYMLKAIRMAVPEPGDATIARLVAQPPGSSWLADIVQVAYEATWARVQEHTRLGDTAPIEPVSLYVSRLESAFGDTDVDRRIATAVDEGLSIVHLAARLVDIEVVFASAGPHARIGGFDATAFLGRIGRRRVIAVRAHLDDAAAGTRPGALDRADVSWANRRRFAASTLIEALDAGTKEPGSLLPNPPEEQLHPFTNHRPSLIKDGGESLDLTLQVAVLLPAGHEIPARVPNGWGPPLGTREETLIAAMQGSPISSWLRARHSDWGVAAEPWFISNADGRFHTTAQSVARAATPGTLGQSQAIPVRAGAQLITGHISQSPHQQALLLTVGIGFHLAELDERHQPAEARARTVPLPAAFTLNGLFELTDALVRCVQTAKELWTQFDDQSSPPETALLHMSLIASEGLAAVVDLNSYPRQGTVTRTHYSKVYQYRSGPGDITAAALRDWLSEAGYRHHERAILDIWDPTHE
ncbi:P-loop NTPase fold protein [Solwaraspora sp. WMMD791]|uniref:KAP family P-loop NTPase fold protein n=1 Tax=Solwaraspora sp. WMMD791 TaxID=3016086 RepID=UPI00249C6C7C|nr:P-loop NTPase fold protein [Solwaraspora sp. WMMD791]WFE27644.1 P-loop NTPase fold protein [Solwaraspora sp. WMMD791]WFE27657.1 P-loop NTPase fold protein [Solwaraspora sp. WMMD791]